MSATGTVFQPRGTLVEGAIQIERAVDRVLVDAILDGQYCCVLAPRQVGKSSLCARAAVRLRAQGVASVSIDLNCIGSEVDAEHWYCSVVALLGQRLALPVDVNRFWAEHHRLSPVQRFSRFLRDELLAHVATRVVVFIDEVDATLSLGSMRDDFFAAIRDAYNKRADDPEYERLTFCMVGVAAPNELIADPQRTPFNIAHWIQLDDFTAAEADALLPYLAAFAPEPRALLDAIFSWTAGHPAMTLQLCALVSVEKAPTVETVDRIIAEQFLRGAQITVVDIKRRFHRDSWTGSAAQLLQLYGRVLDEQEPVPVDRNDATQNALWLTGLVAEEHGSGPARLRVRNRVFADIFDRRWLKERQADRLIAAPFTSWLASGKRDDFVLRGRALDAALEWAQAREDLSKEENEFLLAGLELRRRTEADARQAEETARRLRWRRRAVLLLAVLVTGVVGLLASSVWYLYDTKSKRANAETARDRAQDRIVAAKAWLQRDTAARDAEIAAQREAIAHEKQRQRQLTVSSPNVEARLQVVKEQLAEDKAALEKAKTEHDDLRVELATVETAIRHCGKKAYWSDLEERMRTDTFLSWADQIRSIGPFDNEAQHEENLVRWSLNSAKRVASWRPPAWGDGGIPTLLLPQPPPFQMPDLNLPRPQPPSETNPIALLAGAIFLLLIGLLRALFGRGKKPPK